MGGKPTPSAGCGWGVERIIAKIRNADQSGENKEEGEQEIEVPEKEIDLFVSQIGDQARRRAMLLFEELRSKGIRVMENFAKSSLKSQLELANKMKVPLVLILGQKEVSENTVLVRDMIGGVQEVVSLNKIVPELKKNWMKKKKK